jgi:sRNA-binding protein
MSSKQERAASANIIIALLAERFPKCFVVRSVEVFEASAMGQHEAPALQKKRWRGPFRVPAKLE